jgi:ADP-dependent phosphofructokinase/glucokinase
MEGLDGIWRKLYKDAIPGASSRLKNIPGVVIGFHSVVDGIKRFSSPDVAALLMDPEVQDLSLTDLDSTAEEIKTPTDFVKGLLLSLRAGRSYRLIISEEAAFQWIMGHCGYDSLRLGGTSGCMANALAPLGIRRILVYANPLTRELMSLFSRSENLWTVGTTAGGNPVLEHPWEAWREEGFHALHWGFEFDRGTAVKLRDGKMRAPRAGRFYACWNPANNKLQIAASFQKGLLQHLDLFSHMMVGGYQLLSAHYPDGSTCMDFIPGTVDFLKALRKAKPSLRLHLELDTIPSRLIRGGILDLVIPHVDSLGLNEVELDFLTRDLKGENIADLGGTGSVVDYLEGMMLVMEKAPLERVHFHTGGYYLCLQNGGDVSRTRDALVLAAAVAASRAQSGEIEDLDSLKRIPSVSFSEEGWSQMEALAESLGLSESFLSTGTATHEGLSLIFVPTQVVANPAVTVGLGDTISAVGFLAS